MSQIVDEVRLPEDIESGCQIGPSFSTSINTLVSGIENRSSNWREELLKIDAGYGIMDKDNPNDIEDSYMRILSFFRARKGQHRAFLFSDPSDNDAFQQPLRPVEGEENKWQLGKTYDNYFRRITRPDLETLEIFVDGELLPTGNYTVRPFGVIEYVGITNQLFTANFAFSIPVRFMQDELAVTLTHIRAGEIPNIQIMQIRE